MMESRAFQPADAQEPASWIDGPEAPATWSGNSFTWPFEPAQLVDFHAAGPARRAHVAIDDGLAGHFLLRGTGTCGRSLRLGKVLVGFRREPGDGQGTRAGGEWWPSITMRLGRER